MDAEERRKAEFWDRLLALWDGVPPAIHEDDEVNLDEIYDLIQEYRRRPRLDGTWCDACDKMDGHPKDRCPDRPMTAKVERLR